MNNSDLAFDHVRSTLTGECFTVGPWGDACLQCFHRSLTADHCRADGRVLIPCPVQ